MAAPFFALRSFPRTAGRCGSSESPDAPALPQLAHHAPPFTSNVARVFEHQTDTLRWPKGSA